jgi:replicative DNA helicase
VFHSEKYAHELASLVTDACGYGLAEYVCGEISKAAEHRRLVAIAERFTNMLKEGSDPAQVSDWIVAQVESGRELTVADRPELLADVVAQLGSITQDSGRCISTGLRALDATIGGYRPQQLILIGARPSIGKSVLGFQTAKHAALQGVKTMFISIEMPNSELAARSLAMDCGLSVSDVMAGMLESRDRATITSNAKKLAGVPLMLWEPPSPTVEKIVAMIRREAAAGLELVVIDYVSLIRHKDTKKPHWERIGEITAALKAAAKRFNLPVVLLAQVGRDVDKGEAPRRPTLSDLKYSGSLEQDADLVLFLHRADKMALAAELIVAKQRNGPLAMIDLTFNGARFEFTEGPPPAVDHFDQFADSSSYEFDEEAYR